MHSFPTDTTRRNLWIRKIHRRDFSPTANTRVCSLHFHGNDFRLESKDTCNRLRGNPVLRKRTLKEDAVPSIFPNQPSYLSSTASEPRTSHATAESRRVSENSMLQLQVEQFELSEKIDSLDDLIVKFNSNNHIPGNFFMRRCQNNNSLLFLSVNEDSSPPSVAASVLVHPDLSFLAWKGDCLVSDEDLSVCMQFTRRIYRLSDFQNLLSFLLNDDLPDPIQSVISILLAYMNSNTRSDHENHKISFLIDQLKLLSVLPNQRSYSTSLLVSALVWHAHSPSCYRAMLRDGCIILPSERALRRLTGKFNISNDTMVSYLQNRRQKLNNFQATVSLVFDEIYVHQTIDYNQGSFSGLCNENGELATTVLCFMLNSLSGKYCDVITMIPLRKLTLDVLRKSFLSAMQISLDAGFDVVLSCCDNHPVNRRLLVDFLCNGHLKSCVPNPIDSSKRLFLLIDPTHNIKNIYNIFQKKDSLETPDLISFGKCIARFSHIKQLYSLESNQHLKIAHKLTSRCLEPTSIQRSSAKLAFSVFHESTVNAIEYFSTHGHSDWTGTAQFLRLIRNLLNIINVKDSTLGCRKNDPLRLPISSIDDTRLQTLDEYATFFREFKGFRGLSCETSLACSLMCDTLRALAVFLLQKGFGFVLLGHAQSDVLEHRFGSYRQMSGSNYFISVKQLLESEKKIKLLSYLKHT